jgi:integrase
MPSIVQLDACGRRRSPATLSTFHQGRAPRNKGQRYPADPPTVEEIIAVMHAAGDDHDAVRLRGLIIVLWRAGLRISEALALNESDLDLQRGAILVRRGVVGSARGARPRGADWPDWSGFLPPPPRTVHAVLSHTAHRRSCPLAFSSLDATVGSAGARRWFR